MYCTITDLINVFGREELSRLSGGKAPDYEINYLTIEKAIADASAEMNMYFAGRNLLPMPSIPDALRRMACDIARYYLYKNPQKDTPVAERYRERIKQLEQVASGKLSLGLDAAGEPIESEDTVQVSPGRNMFKQPDGGGLW